ncbi:uncharacterized protein ATNIH1004_001877 [Aspergillus tanneri]|uniref:Uncharacterized protein n=1 Tax=Aspergillus tanneri TaxID=1220188 RepID=A0A5M9M2Z2_9EURO|nr:uncharacterized protein ATNIH1004_001877 [Aspergillus tanneri]KAA8641412.1 hypothetical protein ATNIH1004_001877 [Aspergillus tanneri]
MASESGSEISTMSTTADHFCDLCECVRSYPSQPCQIAGHEDMGSASLATHRDSIRETLSTLCHDLDKVLTEHDSIRRSLDQLKNDNNALRRRLEHTEAVYEAKNMLYEEMQHFFDRVSARLNNTNADSKSLLNPIKE